MARSTPLNPYHDPIADALLDLIEAVLDDRDFSHWLHEQCPAGWQAWSHYAAMGEWQ